MFLHLLLQLVSAIEVSTLVQTVVLVKGVGVDRKRAKLEI